MPDELRRAFMADAERRVFEPVFYEHPIHYLVPLTPPGADGERENRDRET